MANKVYVLYLALPLITVIARQDTDSAAGVKDQDLANDKVTSILIQPGPAGPRHVILSDEHELFSNHPLREDASSGVASNYIVSKVGRGHTASPPLLVTYGPASQVAWHNRPRQPPQQLYHHRFAHDRYQPVEKIIPHSKLNKEESKTYPDAISKYASFTKHEKPKQSKNRLGVKGYASRNYENPDFSVTVPERDYRRPQYDEGYDYQENFHDDEEAKFRESIGEFSGHGSKEGDYSSEKKYRPHHSKHYTKHKNAHHENKYYSPVKNYQTYDSQDDEEPYHDSPSGFDDTNGGHVVPLVARFYKQPLPIIQTQLPIDNTGLYVQYVYPHTDAAYNHEQVTNNYYDYPERRSGGRFAVERNIYPSESEWIPINAPVGTVPARSYDIPAPDLSHRKEISQSKLASREPESSSVVVGKMKSPVGLKLNHHLSENSEGVVSAVVRVKQ